MIYRTLFPATVRLYLGKILALIFEAKMFDTIYRGHLLTFSLIELEIFQNQFWKAFKNQLESLE